MTATFSRVSIARITEDENFFIETISSIFISLPLISVMDTKLET